MVKKRNIRILKYAYVDEWLRRAERSSEDHVDINDKFISLWIAFNAWMKTKCKEDVPDSELITNAIGDENLIRAFSEIKLIKGSSFYLAYKNLRKRNIVDMRAINNPSRDKRVGDSLESLLRAIYQTRCNMFHGRKGTNADSADYRVTELAYNILHPLLVKVIEYDNN